jgi:hypothetical protein
MAETIEELKRNDTAPQAPTIVKAARNAYRLKQTLPEAQTGEEGLIQSGEEGLIGTLR